MAKRATIYIKDDNLYEQVEAKAEGRLLSFSKLINILLEAYNDDKLEITIEGEVKVK